MIQQLLFRILLAPVSLLYGLGVAFRNMLYRYGLLKETTFDLPLIAVGNLSIGGAGKTPHIEYLIRLLNPYLDIATLSRGYNRKTKGYINVQPFHTAEQVGDEPLQYRRKFPDIMVIVSESRTFAIPQIIMTKPDTQVVLLDDAYQHRAILPGLNMLLTDYRRPFTRDYLLPSGRLREWRSAYKRADRIIISKCPGKMSEIERDIMIREIKPLPHQRMYFTYYRYNTPYYIFNPTVRAPLREDMDVLLISAIAGTEYLLDYLNNAVRSVQVLEFEDHHYFTGFDMSNMFTSFNNMSSGKKLILTTEKDAMRLELHRSFLVEKKLPVFALPVEVDFHFDERTEFDRDIRQFLLNFKI